MIATSSKVYIDGTEISRVHVLPYLGLLFHIALFWAEHMTKTITEDLFMKAVTSIGVNQRILLILCQTLMLSVVDYGFSLRALADTHLEEPRHHPK